MRNFYSFTISLTPQVVDKFLHWAASGNSHVCYLTSSDHKNDAYSGFDAILAVGAHDHICPNPSQDAFEKLKEFTHVWQDWIFGFFSYDLKNQLENLHSNNVDGIKMPMMHFFVPKLVFIFKNNTVEIGFATDQTRDHAEDILNIIMSYSPEPVAASPASVQHRVNKEEYIRQVNRIMSHIQKGDIYEANYCIEFFSENTTIDPVSTFLSLNRHNPSPFACFYRYEDKYLISSSPERFLAKRSDTLIS
ncbi:MAG: chorismate-binding protein, partial [Bacteroidota bacterium]